MTAASWRSSPCVGGSYFARHCLVVTRSGATAQSSLSVSRRIETVVHLTMPLRISAVRLEILMAFNIGLCWMVEGLQFNYRRIELLTFCGAPLLESRAREDSGRYTFYILTIAFRRGGTRRKVEWQTLTSLTSEYWSLINGIKSPALVTSRRNKH